MRLSGIEAEQDRQNSVPLKVSMSSSLSPGTWGLADVIRSGILR